MFDDYLLEFIEPSLCSALREYVEGGGYREDRGLPENVRFYLGRIEKYHFEILSVDGTSVVFSARFFFTGEGIVGVEDGVTSFCTWDIPLKENGLQIGELHLNAELPVPEWKYSGELTPIVEKGDYPHMAELFLRKVFGDNPPALKGYPLALAVAEKLGLKIWDRSWPYKCMLMMRDKTYYSLNDDCSSVKEELYEAGTIVYDSDKIPPGRDDLLASVILHGCFHWLFHRAVFELRNLYSNSNVGFFCRYDSSIEGAGVYLVESQPNLVVPYLIFSPGELEAEVKSSIEKYSDGEMTKPEILGKVLDDIAAKYQMTDKEAKLSLIERGMSEFRGIKCVVDRKTLENYTFAPGTLEDNETFELSGDNMHIFFRQNKKIRNLVLDGAFIYVDSHLVLNIPRYVGWNNPITPVLTSYALSHADECFMKFRAREKTNTTDTEYIFSHNGVLGEKSMFSRLEYEVVAESLAKTANSDEWKWYLRRWLSCDSTTIEDMMRKILRMRETGVIINSSDEVFTSSSLVYIMRKDSQAAVIVAGKLNMPYEIMIWFLEKLGWYVYNRKIDMDIYLKAMGTDFYPDGISDAVREEIDRRLGKGTS